MRKQKRRIKCCVPNRGRGIFNVSACEFVDFSGSICKAWLQPGKLRFMTEVSPPPPPIKLIGQKKVCTWRFLWPCLRLHDLFLKPCAAGQVTQGQPASLKASKRSSSLLPGPFKLLLHLLYSLVRRRHTHTFALGALHGFSYTTADLFWNTVTVV